MKARLWVLVIILIAILMVASLYVIWRQAGVEDRVEKILKSRLGQLSGGQVDMEELRLGLGYVHIRGLTLRDEERGYVLLVEQARLSLSVKDHILGSLGYTTGIKEVLLTHPRLEIDLDRLRRVNPGGGGQLNRLRRVLPGRITVSKGSMIVRAAGISGASELTSLDGWLERGGQKGGMFRCRGTWGGGDGNLVVSGSFDKKLQAYDIHGELRTASLPQVLGPVLSDRYRYQDSQLSISLQAHQGSQDEEPRFTGEMTVSADSLFDEQLGISLKAIRAQARLDGHDLIVQGAEAEAMGGQVWVQGCISDLLQPVADLRVELRSLEIGEFFSTVLGEPSKGWPRGQVSLQGTLKGSGSDLRFQGHVAAPEMWILGHRFVGLSGAITNQGARIIAEGLTARLPWGQVKCQGELDLSTSPGTVLIDWRLDQVDVAVLAEMMSLGQVQGWGFLAGRMTGPATAPRLTGGFQLEQLRVPWLPVENLQGRFHWDGMRLSYCINSSDGRLSLQGGADGLARQSHHQAVLQAKGIALGDFRFTKRSPYLSGCIDGRWMLTSTVSSANVVGEFLIESEGHTQGRFRTHLTVERPWGPSRRAAAQIVSQRWELGGIPLDFVLRLSADKKKFWLQELRLGNELRAHGRTERGSDGRWDGLVSCSQVNLRWPLTILHPALAHQGVGGFVSGVLSLTGTGDHPELRGELLIQGGEIGQLRDLKVDVPLRLKDKTMHLPGVVVRQDGQRIVTLTGQLALGGPADLLAHGENIPVALLSPLFGRVSGGVDGSLRMACWLRGPWTSPDVDGVLRWRDGRFGKVEFDETNLNLRARRGLWHLDRFSLDSWNKRHIWARGMIPDDMIDLLPGPSSEEELDLTIGAQGEILSLLPALTSSVSEARGQGDVHFRVGGSPEALVIGSGRCQLKEAWIEPAIFIERIENISGLLEIDEEQHFLKIEHLTGTVEGRSLHIKNYPYMSDATLEAMVIPGLGLNLGVLALETAPEGIAVNVPGLMAKGETGEMRFSGHNLQSPLLIAGPLESPRVVGSLSLNHFDFTYPPVSLSDETSLHFLAHIDWDLSVVARKDVWYENDYASLRVGDTTSKLHFSGSTRQGNLNVFGHIEADRGEITYLDRPFQLVKLEMDFEGHQGPSSKQYDNRPFISGQFQTTIFSESTGVATDIDLTLYTLDPETGEKVLRGQWGEFELELSSSDPSDDTPEKILAKLGYTGDYAEKALGLLQVTLGPKLKELFLRPVIQPVERTIKRALGIDVIRLQPGLTWNLLSQGESSPGDHQSLSRRLVFPRTSLLVGKYLTDDCLISYLGRFRARTDEFFDERLGISHRFGLEYRLSGGTILDIQYDYERDLTEGDKKIKSYSDKRVQIRHHFPF